ncbi:MAG: SpoIIE family protein phosphatase [Proteobacteria bacterium]|nr:SpoIIE family protein phosphatase [Pseudomonadota bacterium]
MLKNKGIAFKLVLLFTLSSICIFTPIFGYNHYVSRQIIERGIGENSKNLILASKNKIEAVLASAQKIPENISYFLENSSYNESELYQLLYTVAKKNPEIYGITIAFEPYAFKKDAEYFAPCFFKEEGGISFKHLDKHYNYFFRDWYQIPKELQRPEWTEPYFDDSRGILMCSYGVPFYKNTDGRRQLAGVVVVEVSIEKLREIVSSIKILKTGYGFLISKNGTYVTHPMKELIMNETIFSIAEARDKKGLREIGRRMIKGESSLTPFMASSVLTGKECWMTHVPIESNGWSLAVLFPQDELMEDIVRLNKIVFFLGVSGIFLLAVATVYIARSITGPLRAMAKATEGIGSGNLDIELPVVTSGDEVGRLTEAFGYMKTSLKAYIEELTETTALKERMESELKVAHDIQMSILPKMFPPFPDRMEFDIYAMIRPAKEVGGDFYDFFQIDHDHLCFVIADVSGKGIPASLFMAVTKTLIKSKATVGLTPDRIISRVNEELCVGNDTNMFVTIFCAILNVCNGEMEYTNGGHNPPLIIRKTGEVSMIKSTGGIVVGVIDDAKYTIDKLTLEPGDSIYLYTDGVNEAMNKNGEFFSDKRLEQGIIRLKEESIKDIIDGIMEEIEYFVQDMPQSDDITMMVIQYKGNVKKE